MIQAVGQRSGSLLPSQCVINVTLRQESGF